jgi:hypothetical protein
MKVGLFLAAILFSLNTLAISEHLGPNPIKRSVECRIVDANTGEALTGVQISLEGSNLATWSDEEGKFSIELSATDSTTLICSLVSFETITMEVSQLAEGDIILLRERE